MPSISSGNNMNGGSGNNVDTMNGNSMNAMNGSNSIIGGSTSLKEGGNLAGKDTGEKVYDEAFFERANEKYKDLLQPLKDIGKAWQVDVTDCLAEYIKTLDRIVTAEDAQKLNFAEAAMVVQHSTNTYARKVDMLHEQVYKSLEHISVASKAKRAKNRKASALSEDLNTDFLVDVSSFIRQAKDIEMDEDDLMDGSIDMQLRRVPLWLMPREEDDRRRKDHKLASCHVHPGGTFLLLEQDMDTVYVAPDDMEADDTSLVAAPPEELHKIETQLDSIREGLSQEESLPSMNESPVNVPEKEGDKKEDQKKEDEKKDDDKKEDEKKDDDKKEDEKKDDEKKEDEKKDDDKKEGDKNDEEKKESERKEDDKKEGERNDEEKGDKKDEAPKSPTSKDKVDEPNTAAKYKDVQTPAKTPGTVVAPNTAGAPTPGTALKDAVSQVGAPSAVGLASQVGLSQPATQDEPGATQAGIIPGFTPNTTGYAFGAQMFDSQKKKTRIPMEPYQLLDIHEMQEEDKIEDHKPDYGKCHQECHPDLLLKWDDLASKLETPFPKEEMELLRNECDVRGLQLLKQHYVSDVVENMFEQSVNGRVKKCLSLQMGCSAEFCEFEDVFQKEQKERKANARRQDKLTAAGLLPDGTANNSAMNPVNGAASVVNDVNAAKSVVNDANAANDVNDADTGGEALIELKPAGEEEEPPEIVPINKEEEEKQAEMEAAKAAEEAAFEPDHLVDAADPNIDNEDDDDMSIDLCNTPSGKSGKGSGKKSIKGSGKQDKESHNFEDMAHDPTIADADSDDDFAFEAPDSGMEFQSFGGASSSGKGGKGKGKGDFDGTSKGKGKGGKGKREIIGGGFEDGNMDIEDDLKNSQFFAGGGAEATAYQKKAERERAKRMEKMKEDMETLELAVEKINTGYAKSMQHQLAAKTKNSGSQMHKIYTSVREWEEKLAPVLEQEMYRRDFNFHTYCSEQLDELATYEEQQLEQMEKKSQRQSLEGNARENALTADVTADFNAVTKGKARHEVCRRFLTMLVLCNTANVKIVKEDEEKNEQFEIKLIDRSRNFADLGKAVDPTAAPPTTKGKKGKKNAANDSGSAMDVGDDNAKNAANDSGSAMDVGDENAKMPPPSMKPLGAKKRQKAAAKDTAKVSESASKSAGPKQAAKKPVDVVDGSSSESEDDLLADDKPKKKRKKA